MLSNRKSSQGGLSIDESNYSEEGFESVSMSKSAAALSNKLKKDPKSKIITTPIKEEDEKNTTKNTIKKGEDQEDSDDDYSEDYTQSMGTSKKGQSLSASHGKKKSRSKLTSSVSKDKSSA